MPPQLHHEPPILGQAKFHSRTDSLSLRATVGKYGQTGRSSVWLDTSNLGDHPDSFGPIDLGLGKGVNGKQLRVTTVITDISTAHNNIYFKLEVLQGTTVVYFEERSKTVPSEGDSVQFDSFITLLLTLA